MPLMTVPLFHGGYNREEVDRALPENIAPDSVSFLAREPYETDYIQDIEGEPYQMYICSYDTSKIGFPLRHGLLLQVYYRLSDIPHKTKEEYIAARRTYMVTALPDWEARYEQRKKSRNP